MRTNARLFVLVGASVLAASSPARAQGGDDPPELLEWDEDAEPTEGEPDGESEPAEGEHEDQDEDGDEGEGEATREPDGGEAGAGGDEAEEGEEHEVPPGEGAGEGDEELDDGALGGSTTSLVPSWREAEDGDSTLVIPPLFMRLTRGETTTTAFFPFFFGESEPDDRQLLALLYYQRRGLEVNADVLFPLVWSYRGVDWTTFSIPPFYWHEDPEGAEWGLPPLVMHGVNGRSRYTILPPLLTIAYADEDEAYTFSTLFWRVRDEESIDFGLFPLLWRFSDGVETDTIFAPFYFRFSDSEDENALTIVPPVYHEESPGHALYGLLPLFHHYHDSEASSLTIPPLLTHWSRRNSDTRLITPAFLRLDVDGNQTFLTWLYQRHRGDTELDAVAPLFFSIRDPREDRSALVILPPLFWDFRDPGGATTVLFPFFGSFHEAGLYRTWATLLAVHTHREDRNAGATWVFPTLQLSHDVDTNTVNFHPLVYWNETNDYHHHVVAPFFWDFEWETDDYRATVAFPFGYRFRSGPEVKQIVLNTYWREYEEDGANGWEFHFFPLFAFGKPRPEDHWWSILYGLAGYRRQGSYARTQILYIPFQTAGPSSAAASR